MADYGTNGDGEPLVPKVKIPDYTLAQEAKVILKPIRDLVIEDEDPWEHYRGKSVWEQIRLTIFFLFPIFEWASTYKASYLFGDIVAGLTITSLAVPQDLGYAKLANLPPVNGLYTSFVPPLVYAVFGSSRQLAIGPVSVVSSLLGNLLKDYYSPTISDPSGKLDKKTGKVVKVTNPDYYDLAITATFFAGIIQTGMGLFRLGFVIDFLSHAAIVGFMGGAAITIGGGQLKGFLGYTTFSSEPKIHKIIQSIVDNTDEFQWRAFVIGLVFLLYLFAVKILSRQFKDNKFLFFLNATGPLVSVIITTVAVAITKVDEKHNLKVVGHIKKGVNPSSIKHIRFDGDFATDGVKVGIVAGLVALTEAVAIGRTFAALEGYHIDGNKEMTAIGLGNLFGSFTSCYVATGSFSRTAVNYNAGAKTPLTNLIMAFVILLTLLFITPLFKHLPNAILSAIIIAAVSGLVDLPAAYQVWKADKFDFIVLISTFFGVLFISVEIGLLIAVSISFVKVVLLIARPHTAVLGKIPGTTVYRNINQYDEAQVSNGIIVIRVDANIYFANANYLREKVFRLAERYDRVNKSGVPLQFVILELTPVSDIDTTGIHALHELLKQLKARDITLGLSNPASTVLFKLRKSGFAEHLGDEWLFLSVHEAVKSTGQIVEKSQV